MPMEPLVVGGIVAALLPLVWFIANYNTLVRTRNQCVESWSDIDTELKRRHDLVPNLVATVQGYATHERTVFEMVARARASAQAAAGSPKAVSASENALSGGIRQLIAVGEAYPDLKANASYLALQKELSNTEDRIQRARRFYNANVRDLNTRIEVFPSNIVAGAFHFQRKEFFELESASEREVPQAG